MPRIGTRCCVDKVCITDQECLDCKASGVSRTFRMCPYPIEMLKGMQDTSGRATAHISATMLTAGCPRRVWLERHTDWYGNPDTAFPAWRGTMGHLMTERHPHHGCVYEQRFETEIILPISGANVLVTGQIDKLDISHRHIEDFKTKTEAKLGKLTRPEADHILQLNIYRWLVMVGWPQKRFAYDDVVVYKPGTPAEIEIDSLRLVYWSFGAVKQMAVPLMDLEDVEAIVVARFEALAGGCPPIPHDLDPLTSRICCDWCSVREECLSRSVGF